MFTLGADPECFVGDNNGVKSIIGLIGGTKHEPLPLTKLGDGFAVQEDNVALEFNIPPSPTRKQFVRNICLATDFLERMVATKAGLKFVQSSAEIFPEEELQNPKALEFGCDPDFNAWTGQVNPRPKASDARLRSCGGHLHIGDTSVDVIKGVKACDLYLGVPSVLMDKGDLRKQLYGKWGAFRKKPYGFEYRVLSNFWIFHPQLIGWAYDNTARALESVHKGVAVDEYKDQISAAINKNDKDAAMALVKKFKLGVVYA